MRILKRHYYMQQTCGHVLRDRKAKYKQLRRNSQGQQWGEKKNSRESIRSTYVTGELGMEEIQNQTDKSRITWFGHVKRMDEHKILKRLLEMKMSGRRSRGRSCT
jgi:hypothetical protein